MIDIMDFENVAPLRAKGVYTIELTDAKTGKVKEKRVVENLVTDTFKNLPIILAMQQFNNEYNPAKNMADYGASETYHTLIQSPNLYSRTEYKGMMHSLFLTDDKTEPRADEYMIRGKIVGYVKDNSTTSDPLQGVYVKNNLSYMNHFHTQRKAIFPENKANGTFNKVFLSGYSPSYNIQDIAWAYSAFPNNVAKRLASANKVDSRYSGVSYTGYDPKTRYFYMTIFRGGSSDRYYTDIKFQFDKKEIFGFKNLEIIREEYTNKKSFPVSVTLCADASYSKNGIYYDFKIGLYSYLCILLKCSDNVYRDMKISRNGYNYMSDVMYDVNAYTIIPTENCIYVVFIKSNSYSKPTFTTFSYVCFKKSDIEDAYSKNTSVMLDDTKYYFESFLTCEHYVNNIFHAPGTDYLVINHKEIIYIDDFLNGVWKTTVIDEVAWLAEYTCGEHNPNYYKSFSNDIAIGKDGEIIEIKNGFSENSDVGLCKIYSANQGLVTSSVLLDSPITKTDSDVLTVTYDLYLDNVPDLPKCDTLGVRLSKLINADGKNGNVDSVVVISDITKNEQISNVVYSSKSAMKNIARYYFEDFLKSSYNVGKGINSIILNDYGVDSIAGIENFNTLEECIANPLVALEILKNSSIFKLVSSSNYVNKKMKEYMNSGNYAYTFFTKYLGLSSSEYTDLNSLLNNEVFKLLNDAALSSYLFLNKSVVDVLCTNLSLYTSLFSYDKLFINALSAKDFATASISNSNIVDAIFKNNKAMTILENHKNTRKLYLKSYSNQTYDIAPALLLGVENTSEYRSDINYINGVSVSPSSFSIEPHTEYTRLSDKLELKYLYVTSNIGVSTQHGMLYLTVFKPV